MKPDTGSPKWKKYARIQGNTYYFDPNFKDDGSGILYVSELADFSKPNGWGTLSSKITYEVECIMSVYRSLEFTYYKQRMGKGEGKRVVTYNKGEGGTGEDLRSLKNVA